MLDGGDDVNVSGSVRPITLVDHDAALTPMLQSNEVPTAAEAERIQRFIKSRRRDIEYISIGIAEEDSCIETCSKAIANLEITIPRAKDILKAHEDNLTSFLEIRPRLLWLKQLDTLELELEPCSRRLYRDLKALGDAPILRVLNSIDHEVKLLTEEVKRLRDGVVTLEKEWERWTSSLRLSQDARSYLMTSRTQIKEGLSIAIGSLKTFLRVPVEIWSRIFRMAVSDDFNGYLEARSTFPLRSAAHILAQVCASWRCMIIGDAALWNTVVLHPSRRWPLNKYRFFTHCVKHAVSPVTFVANLSQELTWKLYRPSQGSSRPNQCKSSKGLVSEVAQPNWIEALGGKEYNLYIDMLSDDETYIDRAAYLPFRIPEALTISCGASLRHDSILNLLSNFRTTKSLTLTLDDAQDLPALDIASSLPQLRSLTFNVEIPPKEWQLRELLSPTLEELHIRNGSGDILATLMADVELPHLTVLGISGSGTSFLQQVKMPSLQAIIFYGHTSSLHNEIAFGNIPANTYGQLLHITFEGWPAPGAIGIGGAVSYLDEFAIKTSGIRSIKFVQSWVDGKALLTLLEPPLPETKMKPLSKLKEIVLKCPHGITRYECEELRSLVKKVNIYM